MSDETWKSTFEVRRKCDPANPEPDPYDGMYLVTWDVVNLYNGEVVANYRDENYAKKQAKRRYKKAMKLLEKSFTSSEEVS